MADFLMPIESEWAIMGVLARGEALSAAQLERLQELSEADFADVQAGQAFAAWTALMHRGERAALNSLDAELTRLCGAKRAGAIMGKVVNAAKKHVLSAWQLERFVGEVTEGAKRRRLLRIGQQLARAAADGQADSDAAIDEARGALRLALRGAGEWVSGTDAALRAIEAAERKDVMIPTGLAALDKVLSGGLTRPELTIVGARPGRGKSAFLLSVALSAVKSGRHVAYFSLEMSAEQLGQRALAGYSGVSVSRQKAGRDALDDADWAALAGALEALYADGAGSFLHLRSGPRLTVERLAAEAHNLQDRGSLDLVVVDYLQLLRTAERTRSDFERLGVVSRSLKELALNRDVPVLAAAQVRRQDVQGGSLRAPSLDELRGSGDLEQDADTVLLLHAPQSAADELLKKAPPGLYAAATASERWAFSVDVAKQRQGPNRRVWMYFDPKLMQFAEAAA